MRYSEALAALSYKREAKFTLVGPEPYLKNLFIKRVHETYSDIAIQELYSDQQDEALQILSSEGLFGAQVVIINNFDKMRVESFKSCIAAFNGCLVLSLTDKASVSSRALSMATNGTALVECNKLRDYGTDYPLWISSQIHEAGYTAEEGVDSALFTLVGPNMFVISNELEKLFILKADKVITVEDISKIVSISAVGTSFEIFDFLMKKDVPKALKSLYSFMRAQDDLGSIVWFLGSYFEKMYRMLLLREQKFEMDAIADIVGIPRFMVKTKYMPRAQAFGKESLAAKIDALCNLDVQMRTFKGDKKILIEKYIVDFSA